MLICVCIADSSCIVSLQPQGPIAKHTADLRIKMLDFRGFASSRIFSFRGWNSHAQKEFPGNFESNNLSRDNLSREIGRTGHMFSTL